MLLKVLQSPLVFKASTKILVPFQKSKCFVYIRNLFCSAELNSFTMLNRFQKTMKNGQNSVKFDAREIRILKSSSDRQ